jgi:integrase
MAGRRLNKLTVLKVKAHKAPGYLSDGGGLYLRVSKAGTKSWVFIFTLASKSREMGLGAFPDIGLEDARASALLARKALQDGNDPIELRQTDAQLKRAASAKTLTFRQAAEKYMAANEDGWKNAKHAAQWKSTLETYAYPVFGELNVAAVDTALVIKVLEPMWKDKTETATRVRGRIESVLNWSISCEFRAGPNPAQWRGHLDNMLPKRSKVAKVKNHPALPYTQIPEFMPALRAASGVGARALEFAILTAARSGEVRLSTWAEIDLEAKIWTVPAERMKAEREHRVPLSDAAVKLLKGMERFKGCDFVFSGTDKEKAISDMTLAAVIKRMNDGHEPPAWRDKEGRPIVPHGFRSTFRDWAAELTSFPNHVAEQALAHTISNAVEASYRRGDLFEKRRRMMASWATYCQAKPASGNAVVGIGEARSA